ncbi:Fc.00g110560.m01.CDS01 [Cosmosporella sp. VM-42]
MNEKATSAETSPLIRERPKRGLKTHFIAVLGVLATISVVRVFHRHPIDRSALLGHGNDEPASWSWTEVEPSRKLRWEKCYDDEFECARLDVPMDWVDPTEEERVVLGVIKLAAKDRSSNLSPVFVNPGGPGGSGVRLQTQTLSKKILTGCKDIISFDPRGVGVSTPRVECWGTSQKRKLWSMQEPGLIDERPGLVYDLYARAVAYSGACATANNDTGIMRHLSTPNIARDMLEILDKTGHEKLRYWGFSYGTVLGGVFAGLFPDRVERLVSDGNCDYHDWFNLDHVNFLSDTDSIFDAFDHFCHKAGPGKCALWASSPKSIQQRRSNLLDSLKKAPVVIPAWSHPTGPELPELVTYSKLQLLTRGVIYKPIAKFPRMAEIYAALEQGDGLPYYDMFTEGDELASADLCALGDTPATMPQETGTEEDAFPAIMCSDVDGIDESAEEFERYAERIQGISRWAGAANVFFRSVCVGRTVKPKWRFSDGKLMLFLDGIGAVLMEWTVDFVKGDTAHPILFIGNMADNVTPLQSAYNNSARFPSSVVLKQNSYGHCSLAAASTCTAKYIRTYFQNGTLPESGTECEPDYELFQLPDAKEEIQQMDDLAAAVYRLANEVDIMPGGW